MRCRSIVTSPRVGAPHSDPFDRAEAIGWHSDFSSHPTRPRLSLSYIERQDPRGPMFGAWRVAPVADVLTRMRQGDIGRQAVGLLLETPIPFVVTEGTEPAVFRALAPRGSRGLGFRFYPRAMRDGCVAVHGRVPEAVDRAIRAVEAAADAVGKTIPAATGSLLIVDNWHCLHDRLAQTVEPGLPLRRAILSFVDATLE